MRVGSTHRSGEGREEPDLRPLDLSYVRPAREIIWKNKNIIQGSCPTAHNAGLGSRCIKCFHWTRGAIRVECCCQTFLTGGAPKLRN